LTPAARQRRTGAGETRLVDRKRGMEAVARGEIQRMADMAFRIDVGAGRFRRRGGGRHGEIDAAGIGHREFQQPARRQRLDMGKADRGVGDRERALDVGGLGRGIGRINRHVDLRADAFDDAGVNLPVEGLRAAAIIGMGVRDGGSRARRRYPRR
jgi:hypothetical protein